MTQIRLEIPEVFQPLWQPTRYKGAYGGRGSGKSHNFASMAVAKAIQNPGCRGVCVREVQKTLAESAKRLIEDKIEAMGVSHMFRVTQNQIHTPGDGIMIFQGMQDHNAMSIKSLEGYDWLWAEESASLSERSISLIRPTIRKEGSELWFSWNPENEMDAIDQLLRGETLPPRSVVVEANYFDNPYFPLELEEERRHDERHNPQMYGHIWLGHYRPQAVGAIFNRANIVANRVHEHPSLSRIVVGVDPAVTDKPNSDFHGIVAAGLGPAQEAYVLEDASCQGSPRQWAERAIALHDKLEADAIVIEVNQGGDMVRHTLESVRKGIRIIEVRATRGKHVRAEPISALYTLGQVHHVGTHPDLERQLCLFTHHGYDGEDSPDRADAAIWALTELQPRMVRQAATAPVEHTPEVDYAFVSSRPQGRSGSWMG